jgi:FkbM family methyltransferase
MKYLMDCYCDKDELYAEFERDKIKSFIDAGAYNGDTVREAIGYFPSLSEVVALEPDPKNFKKLLKFCQNVDTPAIRPINSAVWNTVGGGEFSASGNRNSSVSSTASYQHKDTEISLISIDSLCLDPDYIKYDVEGAELEALVGTDETIRRSRPDLLVSLYHRSRDIFEIPNYIAREYPFYKMKLHRLRCLPAWEIDLLLFDT